MVFLLVRLFVFPFVLFTVFVVFGFFVVASISSLCVSLSAFCVRWLSVYADYPNG